MTAQTENSVSRVCEVERIVTQLAAIQTTMQDRNDRIFTEATYKQDTAHQHNAACQAHIHRTIVNPQVILVCISTL